MDIFFPLIKSWVAHLKDGSIKQQFIQDIILNPEASFLADLNIEDVTSFWFVDAIGNKMYGIDVVNRIFIINGCLVKPYTPDGDYRLIAALRTMTTSQQTSKVRKFAFGLQATINDSNFKLLFAIMPDGSVIQEDY